jgi:tetratricopeptide (TPR) repeat protein
VRISPENSTDYYFLGMLLRQKDRLPEALECLNHALELGRRDAGLYAELGQALAAGGDGEKGLEYLQHALELKPTARQYYLYGLECSRQGKYEDAAPYLKKAIELNPQFAEAYTEWGIVYYHLSNLDVALEGFNAAIQVRPERSAVFVLRAEWDKALQDAQRGVELEPDNAQAYKARGIAHKVRNETEEALADFHKFLQLDPRTPLRKWAEDEIKEVERANTKGLKRITRIFGRS